jgi:hypothetical protein
MGETRKHGSSEQLMAGANFRLWLGGLAGGVVCLMQPLLASCAAAQGLGISALLDSQPTRAQGITRKAPGGQSRGPQHEGSSDYQPGGKHQQ